MFDIQKEDKVIEALKLLKAMVILLEQQNRPSWYRNPQSIERLSMYNSAKERFDHAIALLEGENPLDLPL